MKNGFIKSKKGIGALHTAALEAPVIRGKEDFACGPPTHTLADQGTPLTVLVRRSKSRFHARELCGSGVLSGASKTRRPNPSGTGSAAQAGSCSSAPAKEQHWLLPEEEARPETLPCVAYALEREFLWLTQHLTERQSLSLSFHKSVKTVSAGKPFIFPRKKRRCATQ